MKTARVAAVEFRQMQSSENDNVEMETEKASPPSSTLTVEANVRATRRRSLSLAESQPSVETVIVKAKRAAQSLWMLLHAQSCVLGQKCPHTGCQEAKLLHLHLKTCQAGPNGECPMCYHGCDQSRKLLAHYRRCRTLRARQHANGTNGATGSIGAAGAAAARHMPRGVTNSTAMASNSANNSTHHCLVCSLMARQARTVLERTKVTTSSTYANPTGSTTNGTLVAAAASIRPTHYMKKTNSVSNRKVSYVLSAVEAESLSSSPRRGVGKTMSGSMPPPPRRTNADDVMLMTGGGSSLDSLARLYATAKHLEQGEDVDDIPMAPRRERAASDAEVLLMHQHADREHNSLISLGDATTFHGLSENSLHRRERSASCGTAPTGVARRRSSNRLSPSMCDTILEDEDEPFSNMGTGQGLAEELVMDQGA